MDNKNSLIIFEVLGETKGRNREAPDSNHFLMAQLLWLALKEPKAAVHKFDYKDYVSLSDLLDEPDAERLVKNWLNDVKTLEFLAVWEHSNNPMFDMDVLISMWLAASIGESGISPEDWVQQAKGLSIYISRKYPGKIFLHKDLALHLKSWLYPQLRYDWIRRFQELIQAKKHAKKASWSFKKWIKKQMPRNQKARIAVG